MVITIASSGKSSCLLLLLFLLSASTCTRALDPNACPYDFTVLKRLGDTDAASEMLHLQSDVEEAMDLPLVT